MSDEATNPDAPAKSGKLKTIIMLVGVVVAEAVLIVGAMTFIGGPSPVQADGEMPTVEEDPGAKIVETLVLDAKLPNNKPGVTYLYDTEIYLQAREKHNDRVQSELEQFQNEIKAEITAIWRTSEPHHFQEPRLETLTRKVSALLSDRFGADPESGEPIVEKAVVVMQTGFRVDS